MIDIFSDTDNQVITAQVEKRNGVLCAVFKLTEPVKVAVDENGFAYQLPGRVHPPALEIKITDEVVLNYDQTILRGQYAKHCQFNSPKTFKACDTIFLKNLVQQENMSPK